MNKSFINSITVFSVIILLFACNMGKSTRILIPEEPLAVESFAAKELRRYIYLRTNTLPEIKTLKANESLHNNDILLYTSSHTRKGNFDSLLIYVEKLNKQACLLTTRNIKGGKTCFIIGGDESGLLFGTYKFLEKTGIAFRLDGDIIPDNKSTFLMPQIDTIITPAFELRGILPFHDFPEGPDYWTQNDYNAYIAQLPKLGMNFIGFHTYPEKVFGGWEKAEPVVWIGLPEMVNPDGTVNYAYPALHANTLDSTWGYSPVPTSNFLAGAAQIFDHDVYGAPYMKGVSAWPHTEQENIAIFNCMGKIFNQSFSLANFLNVKTCIGTEAPLTIPKNVISYLTECLILKYVVIKMTQNSKDK